MGTPTNRTPVRVARGSTTALNTGLSDIQEGEIVWDTTTNKLKVKEGITLEESNPASDATKADLASPTFTGTPAAPTAVANTNTTQVATTAYVQTELGDYAPLASPTLTGTPTVPGYATLASPTLTGTPTLPTGTIATTQSVSDNTTAVATTAFVVAEIADEVGTTVQAYDADTAKIDVDQTWTKPQRGFISDLTSPNSNTVTIDFDVANNFQMTPTHGCTFDQPLNQTAGQSGSIFLEQGVGAPFGHGWHADYKWTGGTIPSTWSQTAGKVDRIDYIIRANGEIHCVASIDVYG